MTTDPNPMPISPAELLACWLATCAFLWCRGALADAIRRRWRRRSGLTADAPREIRGVSASEIKNLTAEPATFGFKAGAGIAIAGHGGSLRISVDDPVTIYAADGSTHAIAPPPARPPRAGKYVRRIETPQGVLWFVRFRPVVRPDEIHCLDVRRLLSVENEGSTHVNITYVTGYGNSEHIAARRDPELVEQLRPFMLEFVDAKGEPMLFNPSPQPGLKIDIDPVSRNDPNGGIHVLPNGCRLPAEARRLLFAPLLTGLDDLPK